ncbi:GAF domain-containing protein [Acaryochloris sp. IP29b_bin.148]|uniref:GAF domain-containing protein n=1 Tax=Acaryochloris sp. IP29b_bin.148 TaxID=2969218 RepID=UPI0026226E91|nr:GAF domain-containing protein [Acaryochloris sp. IP29b_bin.148]
MTHSPSPFEINGAGPDNPPQKEDRPISIDNAAFLGEVEENNTITFSGNGITPTEESPSHSNGLSHSLEEIATLDIDPSEPPTEEEIATPDIDPSAPQTIQATELPSIPPSTTRNRWDSSVSPPLLTQPYRSAFKAKVMSWALAVSMLPVLAVGTVTYFSGQSVQQQLTQTRQSGVQELGATEQSIQQQLPTLLIGTGITAILAGVIATWLAHRATDPVLRAAQVSSHMLHKIRPGIGQKEEAIPDALTLLERNIRTLEDYIPSVLKQQDTEIEQLQMLKHITNKIRTSLNEEDVLNTTVVEARKILRADRVIVYGFDENWYGTIVAESVIPGLPKSLWSEIRDPCFAEQYVDKYRAGRIQAIDNVYEAGLTDCHLAQLEPFQVKANLVVPILREQKLFGLLIAHQCSQPRVWQEGEINFFAQVASQVGFALEHSRLLVQVEDATQTAIAQSHQASQDYEILQQRLSQLSAESNGVVELFGTDANTAITHTQDQMHEIAEMADQIHLILNEISQTQQQSQIVTQESQTAIANTVNHIKGLSGLMETADLPMPTSQQPTEQLGELINLMGHVVSQVQLQAMNAALEAARAGSAGQSFAEIAEKVHGLSRQLDATLTDVKPLINHIQATVPTTGIATEKNTLVADVQLLDTTQVKLEALNSLQQRVFDLIQQVSEVTTNQVELSVLGHKSLEHLASTTLNATEQSSQIAETVQQLMAPTSVDSLLEDNQSA